MNPHGGKPPLRLQTTTLWEYPSQDYGNLPHGDKDYVGATPAWVIWNLLQRYTREGDVILDPMAGSGTTLDVANELGRSPRVFDLRRAVRISPPQMRVHCHCLRALWILFLSIRHTPRTWIIRMILGCIGKLDAGEAQVSDRPNAYYRAMDRFSASAAAR